MAYLDGKLWPTWYCPKGLPAAELITAVARHFAVERSEILGASRRRCLLYPRAVIIRILRDRGHSFPVIGRLLKRDHTTIMYHAERFEAYEKAYPMVRSAYRRFADV